MLTAAKGGDSVTCNQQKGNDMDIGIGSYVTLMKGVTQVTGLIDGLKVNENGLERVSLLEMDYWFYLDAGWQFIDDTEEDEEEDA